MSSIKHLIAITVFTAALLMAVAAWALVPPEDGMIEEMAADGTLPDALQFARELGTYEMKVPKRGALDVQSMSPQELARMIEENLGRSLDDGRSTSSIGKMTSRELSWVELDLNYDRIVDERDLLALGQPRPKVAAVLPSMGTNNMFMLLIDFPDYPFYYPASDFNNLMFGSGNPAFWYRGLHYYYDQASYGQQNITGDIHGWYTAQHPRAYYHPNDNNSYPWDRTRRHELLFEAIQAADAAGTDFSIYDNDGDGVVDEFVVVWAGPHGNWATFWWGYHTSWGGSPEVDGIKFGSYSWQWERYYGFGGDPPTGGSWDPKVVIHETGHAQGLPDWYDYDGSQGPDGGVGRLDMMDGNWGDHNCFSKYVLGWLTPKVAFTNLDDEQLDQSHSYADAVTFMPGYDPVSPWSEFFMAQYRHQGGVDQTYPSNGMLIWHVDARVKKNGGFQWNNSYTDHKCLRLMEADGLEEIETGDGRADAGDYYTFGDVFSPTSTPNSNDYDGNDTGVTVNDIQMVTSHMNADFTLYASTPPTVTIDTPLSGATVSGDTTVTITASDSSTIDRVQLLADGVLVAQWDTWTGSENFTWNTRCEFNDSALSLEARAWNDEDHVSTHAITVDVSNTGVTSFNDGFESGLDDWKVINMPDLPRGQFTEWDYRASPGSPTPLGSGNEAYVKPSGSASTTHSCNEYLRSQRIDATAYARDLHVTFHFRNRGGLTLFATNDDGANWDELAVVPGSSDWSSFNQTFDYDGDEVYLLLEYTGSVRENTGNSQGANIDDFNAREAASAAPVVNITSHADGDTVSGSELFTANATDDGSIAEVEFFLNGSSQHTENLAPYEYTRNTLSDDNHPSITLMVIATDDDGISSDPDSVVLAWKNERPFPVFDDLESGDSDWSYQNDSNTPDWALSTEEASSGTQSMGWYDASGFDPDNNEGVWYWGEAPASGRHCIDLAHPDVINPVLRFKAKGDVPSSASSTIYLYNTWDGWLGISSWLTDFSDWTNIEYSLAPYRGYSGRLAWWIWSGSNTEGTGLWIDDIEVTNSNPTITSVSPDRGVVGDTLTITGFGFGDTQGTSTVTFHDGVTATAGDIGTWGNTQVTVDIPAGAESGDVIVTVTDNDSNGEHVAVVLPAPVLDDLTQL